MSCEGNIKYNICLLLMHLRMTHMFTLIKSYFINVDGDGQCRNIYALWLSKQFFCNRMCLKFRCRFEDQIMRSKLSFVNYRL